MESEIQERKKNAQGNKETTSLDWRMLIDNACGPTQWKHWNIYYFTWHGPILLIQPLPSIPGLYIIRYTWRAILWHKFHYIMKIFSHYFFKTFPYPHPIPILSKILIIWVLDIFISIRLFFSPLCSIRNFIDLFFYSIQFPVNTT